MDIMIEVEKVKLGMFVAKLDRPWLGTPFRFQGFWVNDLEAIDNLRRVCRTVWVRTDKRGRPTDVEDNSVVDWKDRTVKSDRETQIFDFMPARPVNHIDSVSVEEEMAAARAARNKVCEALDEVVDDIQRGRKIAVVGLKDAVSGITESVLRNPDACMWLRLVKDRDSYTYYHLLDTSALAIAFGRHLGFSKVELADIGLGAMLIDIGKLKLPAELVRKATPLTEVEQQVVRKHVDYSVDLLHEVPDISKRVFEIVQAHHECFNGSGYPRAIAGREIPAFARMVAITDFFDAITSDRPYAIAISPHDAMRRLYDECGKSFQRELVEQFIQCLGIYPTGTLVELHSGEVGIVVGQNRVRRLLPRLMLILGADKKPLANFVDVDLASQANKMGDDYSAVTIKRSVEPEAYGIDPRQFYLAQGRMTPELLENITRLL
ncbi:MAG: HD-GYP domain-containing protein [Gammaproteobacteria bacterium]|nr:HD-GYP domain-containing protein [Gammaproteobacteria bacterium]